MRSQRNLVIGLSITAVTILLCCGAGLYMFIKFNVEAISAFGYDSCDPSTPSNTEALGQFKLPPSTRNLHSSCFGMQGWSGTAQFEMSPSDLEYFVSSLQMKSPLVSGGIPVDKDLATKASTLKLFLSGSFRTAYKNGKSFSQDVLIDISDPTKYVVYVNFGGG